MQAAKDFDLLLQSMQENHVSRSKLLAQQNENQSVEEELQLLQDGCVLYKVVGPILVKQSQAEAKATIHKRLEYIRGELERCDKMETEMTRKIKETSGRIETLKKRVVEGEQQRRRP